jgi:hypothetical protein
MIITVEKNGAIVFHEPINDKQVEKAFIVGKYQEVIEKCFDNINTYFKATGTPKDLFDCDTIILESDKKSAEGKITGSEIKSIDWRTF